MRVRQALEAVQVLDELVLGVGLEEAHPQAELAGVALDLLLQRGRRSARRRRRRGARPSWSRLTPCMTSTRLRSAHRSDNSRTAAQQLGRADRVAGADAARARRPARRAPPRPCASCRARSPRPPRRRRRPPCASAGRPRVSSSCDVLAQRVLARTGAARRAARGRPPRRGGSGRSRSTVSIAWPTVWPRLSAWRAPPSRSSAATTRSFVRTQPTITSSSIGAPAATRSHSAPPAMSAVLSTSA